MKSGKLIHKIEIQEAIDVRDEFGSVSGQTWNLFCYAWASIEPLSGREYFAAAQTQSEVSHKITIRYRSGIKQYYRILWNDRIFDILSILNTNEANVELVLYCSEVTAGGGAGIGAGVSGGNDHSLLRGLANDDHRQYAFLAGRSDGQTIYGGIAAGENLNLRSTSHATKGKIYFGDNHYFDEVNDKFIIKTGASGHRIEFLGTGIMPYQLAAYFELGAFTTGNWITVSNKRVDVNGVIQNVQGVASEPSMVSISPDVNGPSLAIEAYTSGLAGCENQGILAGYDLDDIWGGGTGYSPGYGKKKFQITAKGVMYFGSNLGNTPIASALLSFGPSSDYTHFLSSGTIRIGSSTTGVQITSNNVRWRYVSDAADVYRYQLYPNTSLGIGNSPALFLTNGDSFYRSVIAGGSDGLVILVGTTEANPTEKMRITKDGKVGIGTNTPLAKLGIAGNSIDFLNFGYTDEPTVYNLRVFSQSSG